MDFKAIIDLLQEHYNYKVAIPILVFLILSFLTSFRKRNRLAIKIVPRSKDLPDSFKYLHFRIHHRLASITRVHRKAKTAASNINMFRKENLSMPLGGEAVIIKAEVEKLIRKELVALVKILEAIFKKFFRPPEITYEIFLDNSTKKGNSVVGDLSIKSRYYAKWIKDDFIEIESVRRNGKVEENMEALIDELAFKTLLAISDNPGTKSWKALGLVSNALKNWPESEMKGREANEKFFKSEKILKEALKLDMSSPLIRYNLALILYYAYGDDQIGQSIDLFESSTQTEISRFHYMGKMGLARCYCQNYHRLGKQTPRYLKKAREYADEAVRLVEEEKEKRGLKKWTGQLKVDYTRAKYCQAFAQHITEKEDDIVAAAKVYLDIIKMYVQSHDPGILNYSKDLTKAVNYLNKSMPAVPAVIYNNLGYILMALASRFEKKNHNSESLYTSAKGFLELALRRDSNYKFAHANLGNIERLDGNLKTAERHYIRAIKLDRHYVNGYSELSWVYLDWGEPARAENCHRFALKIAKLPSHKSKVKEYYARAHWRLGDLDRAKQLVREAIEYDGENENYELLDWIQSEARLQKFLEEERIEWQLLN